MSNMKQATHADAELVLKLYDLRREATMRKARHYLTTEFWPESAADVVALIRDFGSERNAYMRQVLGYWEMAASFVQRGILDADLLLSSTGEPIFLYAKVKPYLAEIFSATGTKLFVNVEEALVKSPKGQDMLARTEKNIAARKSAKA